VDRGPATTQGSPVAVAMAVDGPSRTVAGVGAASTVIEYQRRSGRGTAVVAVTRASPPAVGPVRPATGGDAALARAWAADLVATIAQPALIARQHAAGLQVLEEGAPPGAVLRDPARRAPHNAYAVPVTARSAPTAEPRAGRAPWTLGPAPSAGGQATGAVVVDAGPDTAIAWVYDARSGAWRREHDGRAVLQADSVPVTARTVVVIDVADATGDPTALQGFGTATVLRAGRRYAARWRRDEAAAPPRIEQRDGTPFPVDAPVWLHLCAAPCARQIAPSARHPAG
jgi:hypothetical protein